MGTLRRVDQNAPDPCVLAEAEQVLLAGGVLVMPTDSVYGIGCLAQPGNPAYERIFQIKRRDRSQTLPWLLGDVSDLTRYGDQIPSWGKALARAFWPGALTLVVPASEEVPKEYRGGDGTIALRVPDSNLVRALALRVGPLATTSANTHGVAAATSGVSVEERILAEVDLTLDGGSAPLAVASTIVSVTLDGPRILREGALSRECIMEVCDQRGR